MKITDKKIELLQKSQKNIERLSAAINEILSGSQTSKVLRKHNISRRKFEHFIASDFEDYQHNNETTLDNAEINNLLMSSEERVYKDIFGIFSYQMLPPDCQITLEYVFAHYLDKQKVEALTLLHYKCYTASESAEIMHVSESQFYNIHKRAVQKLRKPNIVHLLKLGLNEFTRQEKCRNELRKINSEEIKRRFDIEYGLAVSERDADWLKNMRDRIDLVLKSQTFITEKNDRIVNQLSPTLPLYRDSLSMTRELAVEMLKFTYLRDNKAISVRTANALLRAGYENVEDLNGETINSLSEIKNIGRMSLNELIRYLRSLKYVSVPNNPDEKIRVNLRVKRIATVAS